MSQEMVSVSSTAWTDALHNKDPSALAAMTEASGFSDGVKTATNLLLIHDYLDDSSLLHNLTTEALSTADPDQALNNLERLSGTLSKDMLRPVLDVAQSRQQLLTVLAASQFLSGILFRNTVFFETLFADRQIHVSKDQPGMVAELRARIQDGASLEDLQRGLRQFKAQEILRIGSRDLCGLADLIATTAELSALASSTLQRAYEICDRLVRLEYGAPLLDESTPDNPKEADYTVFGMGKFGGTELNFSSDIDLIYFYRSDRGQTSGITDPARGLKNQVTLHKYFVRLSELITKAIGQPTEDGFVFRVDLRLRPEGNSGEMANSLDAAEIYYESWGQSWERSAMLKARPVAGSIALGEELLLRLEPFVYRRHLDYAMIEDIKVMKQKIDHNLEREREGERNLKLGQGGIREIEFFIQALQLINAGKNHRLRERNSLKALVLLQQEGLIKPEEYKQLTEAYIFLRTVEHRIQVVHEQQTHNLPKRPEEIKALAKRCGFSSKEIFEEILDRHRKNVSAIFRDLFYTSEEELPGKVSARVSFLFDANADPDLCMDILEEKGFQNPEAAYQSLLILRSGGTRGHLTARARRHLDRIAPLLFQEVLNSPDPQMALANLEQFLEACRRARGTFYALMAENSEIIKVLISLFATSQFLSRNFIQHPEILDLLVSRGYAVDTKDADTIRNELSGRLNDVSDYEDKLDTLRRFRNEEFLRIALNDIDGQAPQGRTTRQLSLVADACLQQALEIARQELLPRFGLPFCQSTDGTKHEAAFVIVGQGKLGGMELNYHSDLDIIFIYEGEGETQPVEGTDRERFKAMGNQQYFARLAQRIISVLTLMTKEGYVYQIDTRLRPSGNQGPLVTSLPAYREYHEKIAAPWERQALIKARVSAGSGSLDKNFDALTKEIVYDRPLPDNLQDEIYRLRQRMEKEVGRETEQQLNIKTGRGGMVDVEFLVQYLQLKHGHAHPAIRCRNTLDALHALYQESLLANAEYQSLSFGYKFLRRLENKLRLVHDQSINELSSDAGSLTKLAKHLGYPDKPRPAAEAFYDEYARITQKIRTVFDSRLKPPPEP
ncbi:MAG: bifunctional [glutamate--ammonia ligase]-adenylyl-L-tyrosine phosphorylase/[glutamate--ammonia-ligase] adenylyltransferase [Deltaproteobacteria bacterium]|nr:bifunctional [glutamate--ammonia ligase]-adenylyl-L-tyrosine phosphorylase/[glutamate--ammonia-ligase] adenylyltransferase [Deltaproteobacteria bacterium]